MKSLRLLDINNYLKTYRPRNNGHYETRMPGKSGGGLIGLDWPFTIYVIQRWISRIVSYKVKRAEFSARP